MAEMEMKKKKSFEVTSITGPILEELKLAGWDYTEVINAGILVFSQLNKEQQRLFRGAAFGLDSERINNARDIFRKWILELVVDAQSKTSKKKQPPESIKSEVG